MAEEAGVEPAGGAERLPPDLKSGRPTGDVSLPPARLGQAPKKVQLRGKAGFVFEAAQVEQQAVGGDAADDGDRQGGKLL